MGRLFEGFDARVVDAEDNGVPDGTPGELMLRAEAPFAFATGYFGTPEKTVEAWRNLWFHTGDRVIREPDGYSSSSIASRTRSAGAARTSPRSRSSRSCSAIPRSPPPPPIPVRSELAEDEVMAAIVRQPGARSTGSR